MKKILSLLAFAFALSMQAQVSFDPADLVGSWKFTKDNVKFTLTFKKDATASMKVFVPIEEIEGAVEVVIPSTWSVSEGSVLLVSDVAAMKVKYIGENKAIGNMLEEVMASQMAEVKDQLPEGVTQTIGEIVIADQILSCKIATPALPGLPFGSEEGSAEPKSVVMTRAK